MLYGKLIHFYRNRFLSTGKIYLSNFASFSIVIFLQSFKLGEVYLIDVPFNEYLIDLKQVENFDLLNFISCYIAPYNPIVLAVIRLKAFSHSFNPYPLPLCYYLTKYIPTAAKLSSY